MRQEDLKKLLQREPRPRLRLHLTGGEVFEITDTVDVYLGRSTLELLAPTPDQNEREVVINLLHIIWIEVLPPA
jgi:hypothetical protein